MSAVSLPPSLLAFAPFDWVVLVIPAGLLLGIGFCFYQGRAGTNEVFFVSNRQNYPLLTGISICTALTSIITYISSPGEYVQNGPVLVFLANVIICSASSDQSAVQRFLTTWDAAAARRADLLNGLAVAVVAVILGLVGAALMGFYRLHPESVPPGATFAHFGDAFFPLYLSQFLPTGVSGLVVASLLAATMSCPSAGINALIAIITKDLNEAAAVPKPQASHCCFTPSADRPSVFSS